MSFTMTKLDPIIAVKDVKKSTKWYQDLFGFKKHKEGHDYFSVLLSENDEIILCLHQWGKHNHPTMAINNGEAGNGLILYFRSGNLDHIRQMATELCCSIEEEIHLNSNSLKREFSLRDPDNYYLTITEFHSY